MYNKNFHEDVNDTKHESDGTSNNNNGYTLIEILIALAIFSIGILGVASMQILSTQYNSLSRMSTEALTVGTDQMERLMILPYDDADLDSNPHSFTDGTRTITWNVTDNVGNKSINMTISYPVPIHGVTRTISLNCIKSQDT